ncbi:cellulose biosynthesis cyclic di-GMP-binding regulatory protein BcsB [Komagataeibacter rhaeticus]|nr:cellulose biosynthesis cyclic di-GMP-binding regulatory protein BcsB [Komagataeibacter rhaeticus]
MKMVSLIALLVFATGAQAAPVASKAPAPQPAGDNLPPLPAAAPAAAAAPAGQQPAGAASAAPAVDPAAASAADAMVDNAENATGVGSDVATVHTYSLRELGAENALTMRGAAPAGLQFGVPGDQLVTSARLVVSGAMSPNLQPDNSAVTITLNEQYIGTLRPDPSHPAFGPLSLTSTPSSLSAATG